MRQLALIPMVLACAALGAGMAQAAPKGTPDEQLARALAGRAAGKPTDCIRLMDIDSSRIIDRTAILYTMRNGTMYLNRPATGADLLRDDQTLVTNTHSDQLCSIDTVKLVDMAARIPEGWVGLGPFVPYPKPPRAAR